MVLDASPHSSRHLLAIGVFSFFLTAFGVLNGCRSGPDRVDVDRPPVTGVRHIDIALAIVHDLPLSVLVDVYSDAAVMLAEFEVEDGEAPSATSLALRLDAYIRVAEESAEEPTGEQLVRWARMWNELASLDPDLFPQADAVNAEVAARLGALPDESLAGPLLVDLLEAQLKNQNVQEESIRRNLDELYFLNDDEVRAQALVDAADLIRAEGGFTAVNPVVQQAIAILPVVESPTVAMILNVRLSELSAYLGNTRDVRVLQDQAIRRAETGLLVSSAQQDSVGLILEILIDRGDRPGAEVIVDNIAPVSARALAYAALGGATVRTERFPGIGLYYDQAFETAYSIDDSARQAETVAAVILSQVSHYPGRSPGTEIADLLGRVQTAGLSRDARVRVLSSLYAAYIISGYPEQTHRLRGLIRSADELAMIHTTAAELLLERKRPEAARDQITQVVRVARTVFDADRSHAYRVARVWIELGEYDRAIPFLQDAIAAEQARILARIPVTHQPNPAAVTDLERLRAE